MKIQYFPDTDTLAIELMTQPVVATDAITDDLILGTGPALLHE